MKLIVQIPAFNEEQTIAQTLRDIPRKLEGFTAVETLLVDDGSTDGTVAAARRAGVNHVVQLKNHRGLSAAFVAGIDAALRLGADVIANTDADNQYAGADLAKLVAPIVKGQAEVVVGDRDVASSPYMSPFKRTLQRLGSWAVGKASGVSVPDVTSGFRAFTRDAALQINVFNPFTYTLETIIQSGNRNLGIQSVSVRTNAPTRNSRLYSGIGTYLRKSIVTIFRIYATYRPLKTFFAIGAVLMAAGLLVGGRFLWFYLNGDGSGHVQSLILCAILIVTGFQTWLIALLADLVGVNRRIAEDVLIRMKRLESGDRRSQRPAREERRDRPQQAQRRQESRPDRPARPEAPAARAAAPAAPQTQWVWLLDENKIAPEPGEENDAEEPQPAAQPAQVGAGGGSRRRRRRRGGVRPAAADLPGNRGKHLGGENGE